MKVLSAIILMLFMLSTSYAENESLAKRLVSNRAADPIMQAQQSQSVDYTENKKDPANLNAGKAIMLSAMLPGAGQMYIGSKWRAALFFGIEIAAWGGTIYFWDKGMKKDKEFKDFANEHFDPQKYWDVEYSLAQDSRYGSRGAENSFTGTYEEWMENTWQEKIQYLPSGGFTHELPSEEDRRRNKGHDQQYYEMIGKYINQFGFGWDDGFGDDPARPEFSGTSPRSKIYMDMRYDSNTLLENSARATQVALLNHVAAALDASFTVQALKRNARAELGFRNVRHNDNIVLTTGLNFSW